LKLITSDKRYVSELTMSELLNEYKAVKKSRLDTFNVYITIPHESSLRKEYEEKVIEIHKWECDLAVDIADRLTN
jgi:hypothetical protein